MAPTQLEPSRLVPDLVRRHTHGEFVPAAAAFPGSIHLSGNEALRGAGAPCRSRDVLLPGPGCAVLAGLAANALALERTCCGVDLQLGIAVGIHPAFRTSGRGDGL